jgi:hypothetical protein
LRVGGIVSLQTLIIGCDLVYFLAECVVGHDHLLQVVSFVFVDVLHLLLFGLSVQLEVVVCCLKPHYEIIVLNVQVALSLLAY